MDGSEAKERHRKTLPVLHFRDVPQDYPSESAVPEGANDLPVALHDEPGDEWLDNRSATPNLVASDGGEQHAHDSILNSHGIDLTSQLLVDALSTAHADTFDHPLKDTELATSINSTDTNVYTKAADIDWDD